MSLEEVVCQVNSVLQAQSASGKSLTAFEINKQYELLEGKKLSDLVYDHGFSNIDAFLSQHPNHFQKNGGNRWTGVASAATKTVLDDIAASRSGRKGGSSSRGGGGARAFRRGGGFGGGGGSGGGAIPRVDLSRYGSAFNNHRTGRGGFNNVPSGVPNSRNQRPYQQESPPQQQQQPQQTGLNPRGFSSASSRDQFDRSPPRRRSPSPPSRGRSPSPPRSYRSSNDNYRNSNDNYRNSNDNYRNSNDNYRNSNDSYRSGFDRDENRRRPQSYYDDERDVEFGRYQEEAPGRYPEEPPRQRSAFGRQNDNYEDDGYYPHSSASSRDRERDRERERELDRERDRDRNRDEYSRDRDEYSRPNTQASFEPRRRDDFDDHHYQDNDQGMSRSRSARSFNEDVPMFQRTRSKSRSMREVRTPRSEEDTLASRFEDTPMTNELANEILIRSGVQNLDITPKYVPRNTKQNASSHVVEIFENEGITSLKVHELIQWLNRRGVDLPIKKYGDIGSLKRLKEAKPKTLKRMEIDEDKRVINYLPDPEEEAEIPKNRRPDSELIVNVPNLHDQLEMLVGQSLTIKQAIERLNFVDENGKTNQIALAILQKKPQVFTLDRLDERGTISRMEEREVTANREPILSDEIRSPAKFLGKNSHPWSTPAEFNNVPKEFKVEVVKFAGFQTNFYVRDLDQNENFERMQKRIQIIAEAFRRNHGKSFEAKDWRQGDACLVHCRVSSNDDECEPEWHRAIFEKYDDEDDLLVVTLIDIGHKKSAQLEDVIPMPTTISKLDAFAIRCCVPDFTITDEDEYEEIEKHWKDTFDSKAPIDMMVETLRCNSAKEGLVVHLKSLNKSRRYFDILGSLSKCIHIY